MKLSAKKVEKLKAPGRYGDGHNLYLQINPKGVKSWLLRYERNGVERWMGLGALHTFSLAEARDRARKQRQLLADGIDPLLARDEEKSRKAKAAAAAVTFKAAAETYYAEHEGKWSNAKHRAQFLSTLRDYAFPKIGNMMVADIDTPAILGVLKPIWHTKTETASRVRSRIERVLAWATVNGFRTGDNPAKWTGHIKEALPGRTEIAPTEHHEALPFAILPEFVAALRKREAIAARALEFLILTAARTGEVIGAKWDEFDLEQKIWIVPAERMKMKREHRVPLSGRAVKILEDLPREGQFVFLGGKAGAPMSNMAMLTLLRRMGRGDLTVHGFRSTFKDWASERTAFDGAISEAALAHVVGDKVEAAYRRGDLFEKRRRLMQEWASYCEAPVPAKGANVTSINARSK